MGCMTRIFNTTEQKEKRRTLRKTMPIVETLLWIHLKGKQMKGYKFRRQYSVGRYVVDFYCPEAKLAIEIDGDSHYWDGAKSREHDAVRQTHIESFGIRFLRFTNSDISSNSKGVLEVIARYLPSPLLGKEGKM